MLDISRPRTDAVATRSNLAACIAALLAASAPAFGEVVVTSCADDGGFDTLRHAVLVANNGETVNMSALACSKITLQSGAIEIGLPDLTIVGPGAGKLTIDGADADRVFKHSGLGTLTLNDLTVAHGGWAADKAYGGCIYSKGNVSLNRSVVTACTALGQSISAGGGILVFGELSTQLSAITDNAASTAVGATGAVSAIGGGVFAANLRLIRSIVSGNMAQAPLGKVYGGGVVALKGLTVKYSTLSDNTAISAGDLANYSAGGAMVGTSATTVIASTIDHNTADVAGAVLVLDDPLSTASITMSTISSNIGNLGVGAISSAGKISILGSTIAFNTSGSTLNVGVQFSNTTTVQSTIIADNSPTDVFSSLPIAGGKNLIKIPYAGTVVPIDTISLDPNLQPLALDGGVTRTHALGNGSPAIDAGSNAANYDFDQRGPTYPRAAGAHADIGAYEVDSDHIFGTAMDFPLAF